MRVGICLGALIGALQGFVIAYLGVPAFIVTLGGLLVWRGAAWWVASGKTLAPLDSTFGMMGGGGHGTIGATASWVIGVVACIGILVGILNGRRQRQRFNFPLRPIWAEIFLALDRLRRRRSRRSPSSTPIRCRSGSRANTRPRTIFPGRTAACSSRSASQFRC